MGGPIIILPILDGKEWLTTIIVDATFQLSVAAQSVDAPDDFWADAQETWGYKVTADLDGIDANPLMGWKTGATVVISLQSSGGNVIQDWAKLMVDKPQRLIITSPSLNDILQKNNSNKSKCVYSAYLTQVWFRLNLLAGCVPN